MKYLLALISLVFITNAFAQTECVDADIYNLDIRETPLGNSQFFHGLSDALAAGLNDPPKQPCNTEFKTKGSSGKIHYTGELSEAGAKTIFNNAYANAKSKAEAFCKLMGPEGCKKVEFVKYEVYDSTHGSDDGGTWAQVDLVVVWKCVEG